MLITVYDKCISTNRINVYQVIWYLKIIDEIYKTKAQTINLTGLCGNFTYDFSRQRMQLMIFRTTSQFKKCQFLTHCNVVY